MSWVLRPREGNTREAVDEDHKQFLNIFTLLAGRQIRWKRKSGFTIRDARRPNHRMEDHPMRIDRSILAGTK